jgi:hypothetical protein
MLAGVEDGRVGGCRLPARRHQLDDLAFAYDNTAFGSLGENGKGVLDPDRLRLLHVARHPRLARLRLKRTFQVLL